MPECRGITPEELQKIDFSRIDFSAFYDGLNSNSAIPADNNQMEKMKEWMKAMFDQGAATDAKSLFSDARRCRFYCGKRPGR
ncbi:hypothetical protein SY86_20780 [Erwinia tracheiphila]|uniref:Uncharacterized protein n=1 Tax=Erwinia tracheiphila TaxID=65700 RepID=A0A0M2KD46_9GAMM|nr:conjugal transfer mating pair stabilization protein TraN [Erwinia tracheiphila PSU-1]KKF37290.1 hypothetical protein SY86_20780 [Erwinia tracheiphila]